MSMYYEITGFVTYNNPEFEVESVVERLEQEGIAVDIFPGTLGSSRIEFSFFNDAHYGFEEEILRILTKNNLELLSGEVSVDTSEEGTVKYELLHGEIRKKTEKTVTKLFVDYGSMWNELRREHSVKKQYSDVYYSDACYTTQKEEDFEERQCGKYRKYQLDWLYDHGYSVEDVLGLFAEYVADFVEDEEERDMILSAPHSFLMDRGFNGECFACKEEFFDCEGSAI